MRSIDLEKEREFENRKVSDADTRKSQSKFYWAVRSAAERHAARSYAAIQDKNVLEIGCSQGNDAVIYAQYCKKIVGIDISDSAIEKANERSIPNAMFQCTDGHSLPFDDEVFDCVIVNSLLHHLDLELAFAEISRVLTDSGVLIFREPLGTNPAFQMYRVLTPSARTPDERPFTFSDIKLMKRYFVLEDIQWFGFTNILAAFIPVDMLRRIFTRVDDILAYTPMRYLFWQFAGIARKR